MVAAAAVAVRNSIIPKRHSLGFQTSKNVCPPNSNFRDYFFPKRILLFRNETLPDGN